MSTRTIPMTDTLHAYLLDVTVPTSPVHTALRERTAALSDGGMQISPEQGQFMHVLTKLLGVKRALEVGTFTGFSALRVAEALPSDGELVCCDVSEEWTRIAREHWQQAGVSDRIRLHLAPARQTLERLVADGQADSFDMAFIDADKEQYSVYYELCLQLVRPGGAILLDNMLWNGQVANPDNVKPGTLAIRSMNETIAADTRVDAVLIPIGDGLTLARKR